MQICAKSDRGKVREINEDCYAVEQIKQYTLLMVADGMGGHNAGEVASSVAVQSIQEYIREQLEEETQAPIPQRLEQAMSRANELIYNQAKENPDCTAMGTTAVVCCTDGTEAFFANVGDSRAYLLGLDGMEQVTEDHSLVMELIKQGEITPEEAEHHPQRNVITRALGTDRTVEVDLFQCELQASDMLLLCSDGLTGMVLEEEIVSVMWSEGTLEDRVNRLIDLANERGGYDNITVIAVTQKEG